MKSDHKAKRQSDGGSSGNKKLNGQTKRDPPVSELPGENEYELFFDLVPDLVCVASVDGYFKKLNPIWEKTLGFSLSELLSQPFANFIHPDDIEPTNREVARQLGGGKTLNFINRYRTKDGSYRWLEWHARLAVSGSLLYAAARDITERKQVEEALRQTDIELREAQAIARLGSWKWNIQKAEVSWSDEMFRIFGIDRQTYTGRLGDAISRVIHPDDLYIVLPSNAATLADQPVTYRIILPDGSIRHIWAKSGDKIYDSEGNLIFLTGVAQDISERKQTEDEILRYRDHLEELVQVRTAQLEIAREQAEAANRAKSDFLAVMSHEIRTPLNGVLGLTNLALQTDLNAKQQDYLTHIQDSGEALLMIINDILDFSKIESGKFEIESIDFDLDDVLNSLANLLAYKAHEKGLELVFNSAPNIPHWLVGDPGRLRQVILNLVSNAIKFTAQGDIVLRVGLLEMSAGQAVLEFSVRDMGVGMDEAQVSQVFQPFFQGDSSTSRKYGGTGLGLTISQRLVNMMDGEIQVESQPGMGSTFTFTVRLKCQADAIEEKLASDLQDLKVLVVEGNTEVMSFWKAAWQPCI